MKGIVFTEFLGLVESQWGMDMVDEIIDACDLPSGGAYTAVGTYDHKEIVDLSLELSRRTEIPLPGLLRVFGVHLFGALARGYPALVDRSTDVLSFLEQVENHIHVEVIKLYPDAELPRFVTQRLSEHRLEMLYQSGRHFEDLCLGLIEGAAAHFGSTLQIHRETRADGEMFLIEKTA